MRFLEAADAFDAGRGVNHERTTIRNEAGDEREADLWTSCFTPRELRLLCERAGAAVDGVFAVRPGAYAADAADLDHPEWLVICTRPGR